MVLTYIIEIASASVLLKASSLFASKLGKEFMVLTLCKDEADRTHTEKLFELQLQNQDIAFKQLIVQPSSKFDLSNFCEEQEVSFLFIQLSDSKSKTIRQYLNACRPLRIPYVLFKNSFIDFDLSKVLVPVCFLEEEVEKAQFASALGRFCSSEILILQANDYGSKAIQNTERIKELLDKFSLIYSIQKANQDSFSIDKESVGLAENMKFGLILLTASREYGLDDLIFGAKELHRVKESKTPIMLINPRADLYALCD